MEQALHSRAKCNFAHWLCGVILSTFCWLLRLFTGLPVIFKGSGHRMNALVRIFPKEGIQDQEPGMNFWAHDRHQWRHLLIQCPDETWSYIKNSCGFSGIEGNVFNWWCLTWLTEDHWYIDACHHLTLMSGCHWWVRIGPFDLPAAYNQEGKIFTFYWVPWF